MKTTETKSVVLLHHHLKSLRLPTVAAECEKVAAQAAADNADHLSYLLAPHRAGAARTGEALGRAAGQSRRAFRPSRRSRPSTSPPGPRSTRC